VRSESLGNAPGYCSARFCFEQRVRAARPAQWRFHERPNDDVSRTGARLQPYAHRERIGEVLWSPADIELSPGNITQPDLFVIPGERKVTRWPEVTALMLAIESLSPNTARYDRTVKRPYYQRVGVPEYWIVDADANIVERWRPGDLRPEILTDSLDWHPTSASEPLSLDLTELWTQIADE
jgi:Uma2 family endonuclease